MRFVRETFDRKLKGGFICKHKETLVKTIRYNMSDFRNFQRIIIYVYGDTYVKISRNFTDLSKNYTLLYITGMFEALSLLVY